MSGQRVKFSAREQQVLAQLKSSWPIWDNNQPHAISRLKGGLTNSNFLLQLPEEKFVLRINAGNTNTLEINRAVEQRVQSLAADQNIAPQCVYFDPNFLFQVNNFIEGQHWCSGDLSSNKKIVDIARLLNKIHRIGRVNETLSIHKKAAMYWSQLDVRQTSVKQIQDLIPAIELRLKAAENAFPLVLCHNDLVAENILIDSQGGLKVLDWEYAAMGDPFFDVATVVDSYQLNEQQTQFLLLNYLGRHPDKIAEERLLQAKISYQYLTLLWLAIQNQSSDNNTDDQFQLCLDKLALLLTC